MILHLENGSNFSTILPSPQLRQYVSFYKILTPQINSFSDKSTIIANANATLAIGYNGKKIVVNLRGPSTSSFKIGSEPKHYSNLLLIELSPYGLYLLTGFEQIEFTDKRINLESVSSLLNSRLCNALLYAKTIPELTKFLDIILLDSINIHSLSKELVLATQQIVRSGGTISVKELATCTQYSTRHLNRLFCRQIGVSAKTFSRLIRFNHTLEKLHSNFYTFADLAAESGFYDQSHFIQDFKVFCGATPTDYFKNVSDFSYHWINAI